MQTYDGQQTSGISPAGDTDDARAATKEKCAWGKNALLASSVEALHSSHSQRSPCGDEITALCQALRRYPLPVLHGASIMTLQGGSVDAALAVQRSVVTLASEQTSPLPRECFSSCPGESNCETDTKRPLGVLVSPYRYAASPLYHRKLRESPSTIADKLCHWMETAAATRVGLSNKRPRGNHGITSSSPTGGCGHTGWPSSSSTNRNVNHFEKRVVENESLMNELLGLTPPCHQPGSTLLGGSDDPPVLALARLETNTVSDSHTARPDVERMTVRELQMLCRSCGLLTSGCKADLRQRLNVFYSQSVPVPLTPNSRPTSGGHCSPTIRSAVAPTMSSQLPASAALVASTSPRRTVYRYSSVSPLRQSNSPPPHSWRTSEPEAFMSSLLCEQKDQQRAAQCEEKSGLEAASQQHSVVPSEAEILEAMGAVQWHLLVDGRERVRGSHEEMLAAFRREGVPCRSHMLPCADFMVTVQLNEADGAGLDTSLQSEGHEAETAIVVPGADTFRGAAGRSAERYSVSEDVVIESEDYRGDTDDDSAVVQEAFLSHLFPIVIERKTCADLDASIKSSRYDEQRHLLSRSPFQRIVWLVEGEVTARRGCRQDGLADHKRIETACASLSLTPGFTVVRTRCLAESVSFVRQICLQQVRALALWRWQRCTLASESTTPVVAHPLACAQLHNAPVFYQLPPRGPFVTPTLPCLRHVLEVQKRRRAQTAFVRMLMCVRGCSAALALLLAEKYGSFYCFWKTLETNGREAFDADGDIQKLSAPQKKVAVLLSEFVLAREYY